MTLSPGCEPDNHPLGELSYQPLPFHPECECDILSVKVTHLSDHIW